MKRFLISDKNKDSNASAASSGKETARKAKTRKYEENYLPLSFTKTVINGEEHPQCVICLNILAADSMKPNTLKRHIETKHPEFTNKPREYFTKKLSNLKSTQQNFTKTTSVSSKVLLASYQVSHRIAKCKKPHTIGETLILPAAIDIVSTMLGEFSLSAAQLKNIPLSNDIVSRLISDISEDLCEQLIEKLRNNCFALQVDEATDVHKDAHLIAYVRFADEGNLREELLFCEPILKTITAQSFFDMINTFSTENGIS